MRFGKKKEKDYSKYIKWPNPKRVFLEFVSVIIGAVVVCLLIGAADSLGMFLINLI